MARLTASRQETNMPARFLAAVSGLVLATTCASAQAPVAIVEQVDSSSAGVEFMDYLAAGRVVQLAAGDKMVLGYLKSCWRETIVSGQVRVGAEQSEVQGGKVERTKVSCDGGKMKLSSEQAQKSGAMAFRAPTRKSAVQPPEFTIYGLSPVIEARTAGRLVIERLDQGGETVAIDIAGPQLMRGAFFDLAKSETVLTAGGTYRVSFAGQQAVFKVDPQAKPGAAPVIGRLLRLTPER
jgi:hypothetical protein